METLTPEQRAEALARFEVKFIPEPNSGCWLWTGCVDRYGYGRMRVTGKQRGAHRIAWILLRGSIPGGLYVLHKCDVPCCVNPNHLYPGTQKQNMIDSVRRGRRRSFFGATFGKGPPNYWRGTYPRYGRFVAYIYARPCGVRKKIYLGTFSDREDARRAVLRAERLPHPTQT